MAKGFKTGGRRPGSKNKNTGLKAKKRAEDTKAFFARILPDERENKLWKKFTTESNINIVNFQAFKLAVAYKRGQPIQPHTGEDGGPIEFVYRSSLERPPRQS